MGIASSGVLNGGIRCARSAAVGVAVGLPGVGLGLKTGVLVGTGVTVGSIWTAPVQDARNKEMPKKIRRL